MMNQAFSTKWVLVSMAIFLAAELLIGVFIGKLVSGIFLSLPLRYFLQGVLNLASFFLGGVIVGVISPGIRLWEPAVGAFLAVVVIILVSIFSPYGFLHFSLMKLLVGGSVAFVLALIGANLGERMSGN